MAQQHHESASSLTILRANWAAWLSRGSANRSNPPITHSDTSSVGASSREMSTAPVQGMVSTRGAMETRATALACRAGRRSYEGRGSTLSANMQAVHSRQCTSDCWLQQGRSQGQRLHPFLHLQVARFRCMCRGTQ